MYDFVDQRRVISFTFAIILFIMAFIAPVTMLLPFRNGFITREAHAIGTTGWSFITGGIGFMALSAICVLFAVMENQKKKWLISLALLAVGALGILLSWSDYYYYTDEKFVVSKPFSLISHEYSWNDFESITENLSKEGGTTYVESVELKLKDGTTYAYDGGAMMSAYRPIISLVTAFGGEHIRNGE